jgi:hypothetical protein
VTLIAAVFALSKGSQLRDYEKFAILLVIVLVALAGVKVLQDLQSHLHSLRQRQGSEHRRPTDVDWLLTTIVGVVALTVFYCVVHPLQPATAIGSSAARLLVCTPLGVLDW